jgi:hypothetical protein
MAHAHAARRIPHRAEAFALHRVVPVKFSLSLFLKSDVYLLSKGIADSALGLSPSALNLKQIMKRMHEGS